MAKIAVVYWSGTGNTQAMAEAVMEGAKAGGAEAVLVCDSVTCNEVPDEDALNECRALGKALA